MRALVAAAGADVDGEGEAEGDAEGTSALGVEEASRSWFTPQTAVTATAATAPATKKPRPTGFTVRRTCIFSGHQACAPARPAGCRGQPPAPLLSASRAR